MKLKTTISNILILISTIITLIAFFEPTLYTLWINRIFLDQWIRHIYFLQFFIWTFLHWGILHLFFNSIFIFYFWNIVEWLIWVKKYILFFVFVSIFNWIWITIFSNSNNVWISGFCMALLSYYTLELKSRNNIEYKWWITAIIVNIAVWLSPQISMLWHLLWAIAGVIYYLLTKKFFREKFVWLSVEM